MSNNRGVLRFIARRLALGVLTLLVVSVVVFTATQLLPSDPAQAILGRNATTDSVNALREKLGLHHTAIYQYTHWLKGMVSGEHRIHMTGQQYLSRGFRTHGKMKMLATFNAFNRAVCADGFNGIGINEAQSAGQCRKTIGQQSRNLFKAGQIPGSAVYRGPLFNLHKHWRVTC